MTHQFTSHPNQHPSLYEDSLRSMNHLFHQLSLRIVNMSFSTAFVLMEYKFVTFIKNKYSCLITSGAEQGYDDKAECH